MFSLFKKHPAGNSEIILGMILLKDSQAFNLKDFLADIKKNTRYRISKASGDDQAAVIKIGGEQVAIGAMPVPVPQGDIEGTAAYTYNWPTAVEDLKDHQGHLIVSVLAGDGTPVERYRIFTSVIASLLRTTNAIGVYKGSQSLLISGKQYLEIAAMMSKDWLPLYLWIYFGFRSFENKNSAYTYGLKAFNKKEMEILDSDRPLGDIESFLFNMCHYVLDNNIEFRHGEACGGSADERIPIRLSPGRFVEGESLKMGY